MQEINQVLAEWCSVLVGLNRYTSIIPFNIIGFNSGGIPIGPDQRNSKTEMHHRRPKVKEISSKSWLPKWSRGSNSNIST